jgi:hypothetical protein
MNRTAKILTVLVCFSLCAAGAVFSPKDSAKGGESKTQMVPINNHQPQRGIWLRV